MGEAQRSAASSELFDRQLVACRRLEEEADRNAHAQLPAPSLADLKQYSQGLQRRLQQVWPL